MKLEIGETYVVRCYATNAEFTGEHTAQYTRRNVTYNAFTCNDANLQIPHCGLATFAVASDQTHRNSTGLTHCKNAFGPTGMVPKGFVLAFLGVDPATFQSQSFEEAIQKMQQHGVLVVVQNKAIANDRITHEFVPMPRPWKMLQSKEECLDDYFRQIFQKCKTQSHINEQDVTCAKKVVVGIIQHICQVWQRYLKESDDVRRTVIWEPAEYLCRLVYSKSFSFMLAFDSSRKMII